MITDSYFGDLLLAIQDRIKEKVPEIRWIDQDFNQLEEFDYRPEISFPAVLIDFGNTQYSQQAQTAQVGDVAVQLKLVFCPFSGSYEAAPMDVKKKALNYYTIEQKLHQALEGFDTDFTQPMCRVSAQSDNRYQGLRVRSMIYSTSYEDYSATKEFQKVNAPLSIEPEFL